MKLKSVFLFVALNCSFFYAHAEDHLLWLDQYELTSVQRETLSRWTIEEKFPNSFLHKTALAFQNWNQKQEVYIPEHTSQDIQDVIVWAEGLAFATYAARAGYTFDQAAYEQDCPNLAIYNFGYATETMYLNEDVLQKAISTTTFLIFAAADSSANFSQIYFEKAEEAGFSKYLTPNQIVSL